MSANKTNWSAVDRSILERLDIAEQAAALGIRFAYDRPPAGEWRECFAFDRDEKNPSAAFNVANNGHRGQYTDRARSAKAIGFFELAARIGKFPDWRAAREHYAIVAGVELPTKKNGTAEKTPRTIHDQLLFIDGPGSETFIRLWADKKTAVTYETAIAAGAKAAHWPAAAPSNRRYAVVVVPGYRPADWNSPTAYVAYRYDGQQFPAVPGKLSQRKVHTVAGSKNGLVIVGGPAALEAAETVWLCEGIPDALAIAARLPAGHVAVTNTHGADTWRPGDGLSPAFAGKRLNIVLDRDTAGVEGSELRAANLFNVASELRLVELPYPVEEKHGRDLRDFFNEGHSFVELAAIAAGTSPLTAPPAVSSPPGKASGIKSEAAAMVIGDGVNFTDVGNGKRFADDHAVDVRYCHAMKKWFIWTGSHWATDQTGEVVRRAKATIRKMFAEAENLDDNDRRKLISHALESENMARIGAMLAAAQSEIGIPVVPSQFDRDSMLFNTLTGTIDLNTGERRPHVREDYITRVSPIEYHAEPGIDCPLWEACIGRILAERPSLIRFVRRLLGYCLTGEVSEQILPIFYGVGANGKTTVLNVMLYILGDYAMKAMPNMLMTKANEPHACERADLFGRRLVVASETEDGRRIAESLVKDLTGGEIINARRVYENPWQFAPTHKIILATNHKPAIRGTDHAIWRRIRLVPFDVVIPDADQDKQLPNKLKLEAPAILQWLVSGCVEWRREGLGLPDEVKSATAEYRAAEDTLAGFIRNCCIVESHAFAGATSIFDAFKEFTGDKAMTQTAFGKMLGERGFHSDRITAGKHRGRMAWWGIGLQSERE